MKLIKEWEDRKYKVKNYLYLTDSGVRFLHTLNPSTLETYFSIQTNAGSYFERFMNVPNGTAHLLEHIMFGPNETYKTQKSLDSFLFGNRKRSGINSNASTSFKRVYSYVSCHFSRELDLLKLKHSSFAFPTDKYYKRFTIEKNAVLSEYNGRMLPERNPSFQRDKFLYKSIPLDTYYVLGEKIEYIKSITVEDVINFKENLYRKDNTVISIQSPNKISKGVEKYLEKIGETLPRETDVKYPYKRPKKDYLENTYEYGTFNDPTYPGLYLYILYFIDADYSKERYKDDLLNEFLGNLLRKIIFSILREEKKLIYDSYLYSSRGASWDFETVGLSLPIDLNNLLKVIDGIYDIIMNKMIKYISSKQGEKWLESRISNYLFPSTIIYDEEYAEKEAGTIISGYKTFSFEKAKTFAQKITIKDLLSKISEFQRIPPHIWVEYNKGENKVKRAIESSKFHKHWS